MTYDDQLHPLQIGNSLFSLKFRKDTSAIKNRYIEHENVIKIKSLRPRKKNDSLENQSGLADQILPVKLTIFLFQKL